MKVNILAAILVIQQIIALIFSLDFFPVTDHRIFANYRHISQLKAYRLSETNDDRPNFLTDDDKFSFNYKIEKLIAHGADDLERHVRDYLEQKKLYGQFALYLTVIPDVTSPLEWQTTHLLEVTSKEREKHD